MYVNHLRRLKKTRTALVFGTLGFARLHGATREPRLPLGTVGGVVTWQGTTPFLRYVGEATAKAKAGAGARARASTRPSDRA